MPSTRLAKKKCGISKDEVAPEPAWESSSGERGDVEVVEAEVVDFIDDYNNDEDYGTIDSPPSNKSRGVIGRVEKGVILIRRWKNLTDINSNSRRKKKSLVWAFYEIYEEDDKEAELKWYLCTF